MKHYQSINIKLRRLLFISICAISLPVLAQENETLVAPDTTASTPETVNVAYGVQSRDQVTSSISTIYTNDLRKTQTSTITNALYGRLAGVAVMNTAGAPGYDEASVYIRGRHTLQDNGYLVIVDGFQVDGFNQIAEDEIESISVLKDAAALALYGIKGANGALLITTKRGNVSGKTNISLNARIGYQTPIQLPKFRGSYDYANLYNEALKNDGLPPLYSQSDLDGYKAGTDPYLYPDVNWYDEILKKGSPIQDYTLSFDGGNKTAKYFLMLGYMDNEGLYANTDQTHNSNINFQRINFRGNVDLNLTRRLTAQIGLGGCIEDRIFPPISTESLWKNMAIYAPNLYSVVSPNGRYTGTANFPNNPVGNILGKGYQSRHNRNVQATARLNESLDFIVKGLNAFGAVSFSSVFSSSYDKTKNYAYYEPIRTTGVSGADSLYYMVRGTDSDLSVSTSTNTEASRSNFEGGLDFQRSFGNHALGALMMYHQDVYSVLGNAASYATQNLLGRLTYNYKGKYFAEAGLSYSGTENYAPGKRFGFFPAVSAGWLISKEGCWKENPVVNYLKLKASAGIVGNDQGASRFNYNQYWGTASNQGYYFGTGQTFYNGLVQLGLANPDITWEKAKIYNGGIETQLFNHKLSITADVFYEDRSDILVSLGNVTSSISGVSSSEMVNKGRVVNYGTEANLMFKDKVGSFDYFVGGEFSFARNKIKENYETPKKEAYSSRKNYPVSQYFGLEAIGFFKDESDIASSPVQTFSVVRPGDIKYKDQNNDGIIDTDDEIAIGKHSYPEISYGVNAGVSFKGFDVQVLFEGNGNRSVYLSDYMFWPFVNNANISDWAAEGHWTPENSINATFPRLTTQPNANNYRSSTFWVRNANMLRLRNLELGYTFQKGLLKKVQNMRIYVSGANLFTWDDLPVDVDPETLSAGYPVLKTFSVGLTLNF